MAEALDFLCKDILAKRIDGIPGGNHYVWSARCKMLHRERVFDADKDDILRASSVVERKFIAPDLAALRKQLMANGAVVLTKATSNSRRRAFAISDEDEDLAQDTIRQAGMSFAIYKNNSTVMAFHTR
jgi:hypothetical protein